MKFETTSSLPALEPVSDPIQLREVTEPRAKQQRIGEISITLPMPITFTPETPVLSTPQSPDTAETARQVGDIDHEDERERK